MDIQDRMKRLQRACFDTEYDVAIQLGDEIKRCEHCGREQPGNRRLFVLCPGSHLTGCVLCLELDTHLLCNAFNMAMVPADLRLGGGV